jgi:hypothetical protein
VPNTQVNWAGRGSRRRFHQGKITQIYSYAPEPEGTRCYGDLEDGFTVLPARSVTDFDGMFTWRMTTRPGRESPGAGAGAGYGFRNHVRQTFFVFGG